MSASKIRGGIAQSEASIVLKDGATEKLTITHPANNTAARTLTLPDVDYDFTTPDVKGTGSVTFDSTGAAYKLTIDTTGFNIARTWTLQNTDDTFVGRATTDTFTNKTFDVDGTGNSLSNIANTNIKAAAAIALNKLATLTIDRALISDGSGFLAPSATTSTELGYVSGTTSSIQNQIDNKITAPGSTDNNIPKFDGTSGALQNSGVTIDDSNNITGSANFTLSGDIDKASGAALNIGGTTATTLNLGRAGQTTVVKGDLQVDGTTTTVNFY